MLGVTLRLYNILLTLAKELDVKEGGGELSEDKKTKWDDSEKQLQEKEALLKVFSCIYIDLVNFQDRIDAIKSDNRAEIDTIARKSNNRRNRGRNDNEKCSSLFCVISKYDTDIGWAECDKCFKWMHVLCEGFSSEERESLSTNLHFHCLSCSGTSDLSVFVANKFDFIRKRQKELETEIVELRDICGMMHLDAGKAMGAREKQLKSYLRRY